MGFLCTRRPTEGEPLRHETAESGLVMRGHLPHPRAKIVPLGLQGSPTSWRTTVSGGRVFQTPPDVVVKFQAIDIVGFILRRVLRPCVVYPREIKG